MTSAVSDLGTDGSRPETSVPDRILRYTLLISALPGFPLGISQTLIAMVALLALGALGRGRPLARGPWAAAAGCYLLIKSTEFLLGAYPALWQDFLQAYKAFVFLLVFAFFLGRELFTRTALARTVKLLLVVFALTYSLSGVPRPTVWMENNFELMLLLGFFYLAFPYLGERRNLWTGLLVVIIFLSASRCSLIELGIVMLACYWQPTSRWFVAQISLVAGLGWYGFEIFSARTAGGLGKTDRSNFWHQFTHEVSQWSWIEWVFGTPPLTPLSVQSCQHLSFYSGLFSAGSESLCYSVILHSFAMRVMFDHGVVGAILLIVFLWSALAACGVQVQGRLVLLGIGVANSFSVSAFNSEFFAVVVVVATSLRAGVGTGSQAGVEQVDLEQVRWVEGSGPRRVPGPVRRSEGGITETLPGRSDELLIQVVLHNPPARPGHTVDCACHPPGAVDPAADRCPDPRQPIVGHRSAQFSRADRES